MRVPRRPITIGQKGVQGGTEIVVEKVLQFLGVFSEREMLRVHTLEKAQYVLIPSTHKSGTNVTGRCDQTRSILLQNVMAIVRKGFLGFRH